MTLHTSNPEIDKLAKELSDLTGKTVDEVVLEALRYQAAQTVRATDDASEEEIMQIAQRCSELPNYDPRSPEDILYDETGLPR